ncbi:MAG: Stk1 family PASTA domain-containing Ser/Thr kinase [Oscillospiraceae bacterium]
MDRYTGKKLDGRYEILELIGVGGMANVYRARDVVDDKIVAVKILKSEFAENEEFLRRFKNESRAIAMLSHDNIVKVYDVSFTEKVHFIVMEFIDGITLKEYIAQQGKLSWKEATYYTMQILRALSHAHDNGIVHRDIKPQNVMLLSDGTIKITDFGIARFARSETKTLTDRAIGSVHYISPEQASGAVIDQRTDLYSVGVVLFEMVTGTLPFDADTPISVALKQIQAVPKRPRELNPEIPEGLEEIVMRAMQKAPSKRYQTAAEMLKDFEEFKKNPSVSFQYDYLDAEAPVNRAVIKDAIRNKEQPIQKNVATKFATLKKGVSDMHKNRKNSNEENIEYEIEERTPIVPILAGVTTAFVLVALLFIGTMFYLNNPFKNIDDIKVPELVGQKYDALVSSDIIAKNFIIEVESTDYHESFGKGVIYDQKPSVGKTVKVGSKIKIKVSGGQKVVAIPDIVGNDSETAYQKLKDAGLEYTPIEMFHEAIPLGSIVYLEPGVGSQVPSGTNVTVYVSMGPENKVVPVPPMVGLNIKDIQTLLENYKLKIGGQSYTESDLPRGTIIAHDPDANAQVVEGSYVNFVLSQGDGQLVKLRLTVKLPKIDEVVSIQAMVDGIIQQEEMLNPAETGEWKPIFEGLETSNIQIIINKKVYQVYTLNFETKTYKVEEDLSGEFK